MVTLRDALEDSRNVPTVRLMAALGPREVVNYAKRLGVTSPLPEYLSVAIGAAEGSLIEMTAAYAAFANQGVRMTPIPILEVVGRDGTILEQHRAEPHEAIRADTAYITTSMLEGVIQHGTGQAAKVLDWPLAGKTGTTDDYSDAWFIGFDPNITVGVWVGLRSEEADRDEPNRRRRGPADLAGDHEILDRAPAPGARRAARVRTARQHRDGVDQPRARSVYRRHTAAMTFVIGYWLFVIALVIGHLLIERGGCCAHLGSFAGSDQSPRANRSMPSQIANNK